MNFEQNEKIKKENKILIIKIKDLENEIKKLRKEIEIQLESSEPEPITLYSNPTLIGLNIIGDNCYINSILQCLSQTKDLTNYFLKKSNKKIIDNNIAIKNKNDLQLCRFYSELIRKLWDKKGPKSFPPHNFMRNIEKMNPSFRNGYFCKSRDFITYVLVQIHKELKGPINKNNVNDFNINKELSNQYDNNISFNIFFNIFLENYSIISKTFYGFLEITNICVNCKNDYTLKGLNYPICYNYQTFNNLFFFLKEIKEFKNN